MTSGEGETAVGVEQMLAAGLSYRQLDYATRAGWLHTEHACVGTGHQRRWLASEVDVARVMAHLTQATQGRITPAGAARAARNDGWLAPGVRVVDEQGRPICTTPRPPKGGASYREDREGR